MSRSARLPPGRSRNEMRRAPGKGRPAMGTKRKSPALCAELSTFLRLRRVSDESKEIRTRERYESQGEFSSLLFALPAQTILLIDDRATGLLLRTHPNLIRPVLILLQKKSSYVFLPDPPLSESPSSLECCTVSTRCSEETRSRGAARLETNRRSCECTGAGAGGVQQGAYSAPGSHGPDAGRENDGFRSRARRESGGRNILRPGSSHEAP